MPQIFVVALAIAISLAWFRVASIPAPASQHAGYTWDSAVSEVRSEIAATRTAIARQRDLQRTRYLKLWEDTQALDQKLGGSGSGH